MADELRTILEKTASQNPNDQKLALEFLQHAQESKFADYTRTLSHLLHSADSSDFVRQAAGLQLKNALVAKDTALLEQRTQRWLALSENDRNIIKTNVLSSLGTEKTRPSVAAQCVARIACIELPFNLWPAVITSLMANVTSTVSTPLMRESSLETLGYICQDINPSVLITQANEILTAIVHGMKKEEQSTHVRLAATTALTNALEFTRANFQNPPERHIIMQVVCEATQCPDVQVRVAALECLVAIVSTYYSLMEEYMGAALFAIAMDAMRSNNDEVVLQGIEFWTNICEEEMNLALEAEEANEEGRAPEAVSKYYAKGALVHLVPILTECLTRQEEECDEDEWKPAKSAGVCLNMLAQCVEDDIIMHVMPFITQNIQSDNWRFKEAALMTFGSILEGPNPQNLSDLVRQAMPFLIEALKHQRTEVRDTAAWCIGRACDICHEVVIDPQILSPLLPALSQTLHQEPRVSANVCWAISSLASAAYQIAIDTHGTDENGQAPTYILSPCFEAMVTELLKVTDRPDGHSSNLRISAYEALMELIKNSPKDCYPVVQSTTVTILRKMNHLLSVADTVTDQQEKASFLDLQALLCGTLTSVVSKMSAPDAVLISDDVMRALLSMMNASQSMDGGGVMEDALQAMSALIDVIGKDFAKYLTAIVPFLDASLANHDVPAVCRSAIGVAVDLVRAFEEEIMPCLDGIMQRFVDILNDDKIDKTIKPVVLSAFGDVALAVGTHFGRYADLVLNVLKAASQVSCPDSDDYDTLDYVMTLREMCLEAYTGIVQSVRDRNAPPHTISTHPNIAIVQQHLGDIIELLDRISKEASTEQCNANAAGLIGDLLGTFGASIITVLDRESVTTLLNRARRSKLTKAKTLANYAMKEMRTIKAVAASLQAAMPTTSGGNGQNGGMAVVQ